MVEQQVSTYAKENIYDLDNRVILRDYAERIIVKLKEKGKDLKKLRVLDLGLGHGYSAKVLEPAFGDYTILDGDPQIIETFKKEHPDSGVRIIHTMFEDYCPETTYDVIIMGFVLEHVDDPVCILSRYRRFLKRGGVLYVALPNAEALNRRVGKAAGLLSDLKELSENDIGLGHRRYYDIASFQKECEESGLLVRDIEGIFLKPVTTRQMLKLGFTDQILRAFCETGREYPQLCLSFLAETTADTC